MFSKAHDMKLKHTLLIKRMSQARQNSQISSKFGFQDPDRKEHKHNYAAKYIHENVENIARVLYDERSHFYPRQSLECTEDGSCNQFHEARNLKYRIEDVESTLQPEHPISKGVGQFKTTIGNESF
jgi:hypothetical protein